MKRRSTRATFWACCVLLRVAAPVPDCAIGAPDPAPDPVPVEPLL
jgi:hypothetical protein